MTGHKRPVGPRCLWCGRTYVRVTPRQGYCGGRCRRLALLARRLGLGGRKVSPTVLDRRAGLLFTAGFWTDVRKGMEAGREPVRDFVMGDEFGVWTDVTAINRPELLRERMLSRWNAGAREE